MEHWWSWAKTKTLEGVEKIHRVALDRVGKVWVHAAGDRLAVGGSREYGDFR